MSEERNFLKDEEYVSNLPQDDEVVEIAKYWIDRFKNPVKMQTKGKYTINDAYVQIARILVDKYDELDNIPVHKILFVDVDGKKEKGGKVILAQVSAMPEKWQDLIKQTSGYPYDFVMEIFKQYTCTLTQNQIVALIYHELRHIQDVEGEFKVVLHDIEDWTEMIEHFGPNWNAEGAELPNLLDEDVYWDDILPMTLFPDETRLKLVK